MTTKKKLTILEQTLYELGFLDRYGNIEKNKERRWNLNINEAELILKDFMKTKQKMFRAEIEATACAVVYLKADSKEEAQEMADKLVRDTPDWFEYGCERVEITEVKYE